MTNKTVIQALNNAIQARTNCIKKYNTNWYNHWTNIIERIDNMLPSGSGFDNGSTIDIGLSTDNKIVLYTAYHHMDEHGFYTHWTEHMIKVYPAFDGIRLSISGKNDNNIKEYMYDVFYSVLTQDYKE